VRESRIKNDPKTFRMSIKKVQAAINSDRKLTEECVGKIRSSFLNMFRYTGQVFVYFFILQIFIEFILSVRHQTSHKLDT
jgi:hypothetical protein